MLKTAASILICLFGYSNFVISSQDLISEAQYSYSDDFSETGYLVDACPEIDFSINTYEETSGPPLCYQQSNWLPDSYGFFPTKLADPRIIGYSVGYRTYDRVFKTPLIPISIGDRFSIYQFSNIARGKLFLGVEACVWAIFEAKPKSLSLINADYYIGIPLTYLSDKFAARLRIFHQSSHLGDELLVENKSIRRLNPSMEIIDLSLAYELTQDLTLFAGFGRILRTDESFKIKPHYFEYGFNYLIKEWKTCLAGLDAIPYIAAYFSNWQENGWRSDSTLAIGYQWEKSYGRKIRLYIEARDGFSSEGQFSKQNTRYLALKLLYGY